MPSPYDGADGKLTPTVYAGIALVHLMAAISPGPSFVLSVRTAASGGVLPAAGLAIGFGLVAALWAAAALAGLALLFELVPQLFLTLKIAGGAFLIWLAWKMWRHAPDPMPRAQPGAAPRSMASAIRLGALAMAANPKPAIFFGAVFVGLVPQGATLGAKAFVVFNIFWVEAAWYIVVAWLFSRAGPRAAYARFKARLDRLFGGALAALGAAIAFS